jgi:hypothetical protein
MTPKLTAEGSGYYRVFVDGAEVSRHTTEREAVESSLRALAEHPGAAVRYTHDYVVRVEADTPAPTPKPEPEPEPEPQPEPPSVVTPLFVDDFEGYPVGGKLSNHGANGFRWVGPRYVEVATEYARSGRRSLRFRYGPYEPNGDTHMWGEQRFLFPAAREVWIEFYVRIPENYYHNRGNSSYNNKFLALWGPSGYSQPPAVTFQTWADGNGGSTLNVCRTEPNRPLEHYPRVPGNGGPAIDASHRGRWLRARAHVRLSDPGKANGLERLWLDDRLIVDVPNDANEAPAGHENVLCSGYLLGYDNGRFLEDTDFYVDDFRIWISDPGWG